MPKELEYVYRCSNPYCDAVWDADPKGHCPACIKPDGVGYSTRQLKLISLDEALAKVNPHANT